MSETIERRILTLKVVLSLVIIGLATYILGRFGLEIQVPLPMP